MKFVKYFTVIFVVILLGCENNESHNTPENVESNQSKELIQFEALIFDLSNSIDSFWDGKSGWMNYSSEDDVRYQESIRFLLYMDSKHGTDNKNKIIESIKYSLLNFQLDNGAFVIEGDPGYVRTSLYVVGMLRAIDLYPDIVTEISNIENSIIVAADWIINTEKEWGGNHQIFGMIAMEAMARRYKTDIYLEHKNRIKDNLLSDFVHVNENMGFFPEGPKEWDNRLLMPIVQTQIMAAGYLNSLDNEPEIQNLLVKTINLFDYYFSEATMSIDITDSYDYENRYKPKGIESIPIEVPSVLFYSCKYLQRHCDLIDDEADIVYLFQNMQDNFVRDNYLTLFTDPYYRFAVMEELYK